MEQQAQRDQKQLLYLVRSKEKSRDSFARATVKFRNLVKGMEERGTPYARIKLLYPAVSGVAFYLREDRGAEVDIPHM